LPLTSVSNLSLSIPLLDLFKTEPPASGSSAPVAGAARHGHRCFVALDGHTKRHEQPGSAPAVTKQMVGDSARRAQRRCPSLLCDFLSPIRRGICDNIFPRGRVKSASPHGIKLHRRLQDRGRATVLELSVKLRSKSPCRPFVRRRHCRLLHLLRFFSSVKPKKTGVVSAVMARSK
jgi:hypothetical protein